MEKEYNHAHECSAQTVNATLQVRLLRFLSSILRKERANGFTLLELVTTVAIVGALSSIAIPNYVQQIENARTAKAIAEIRIIEKEILAYNAANQVFPASLADIGRAGLKDPWGNPYAYMDLTSVQGNGKGRKDHFLVPLNTDFDLYSKGRDGDSSGPLTAAASHDDIVRASNGGFVGTAEEFMTPGKGKK